MRSRRTLNRWFGWLFQARRRLSVRTAFDSVDSIGSRLSYRFRDENLLLQALTHRSCIQESDKHWLSNERLELLGDAVLGLAVTEFLYTQYPQKSEGELTRLKSLMVSRDVLAREAETLGFGEFLFLGNGEEQSGGRKRQSILADAFEAVLGAMYLDGGLETVKRFVRESVIKNMRTLSTGRFSGNYKSWLLEYVQGKGLGAPRYRVIAETGPDHRKEFTVEVHVKNDLLGTGKGPSKKRAEQDAARHAVKQLGLLSK